MMVYASPPATPILSESGVEIYNFCRHAGIRNIVLMRPINSMIEFKQIIGRGTRLFDGKDYFTIYDFVKAHEHFNDPEWDGEPLEPEEPVDSEPRKHSNEEEGKAIGNGMR